MDETRGVDMNGGREKVSPILKKILENKLEEVRFRKSLFPLEDMRRKAADSPKAKPFAGGILACGSRHKVIAEIKRFSPGYPKFRADFDPVAIAKSYEEAGAAALSVLTDTIYFGGSLSILASAKESVSIPVLCKEFILDPYQVYEARAYGADAVLLMAVNFTSKAMRDGLMEAAQDAGLETLIEINREEELEYLPASRPTVMINNRDFRNADLRVDVSTTKRLAPLIKTPRVLISASGLKDTYTLLEMEEAGVDAFLIGSSLMSEQDPGKALKRMLGEKG